MNLYLRELKNLYKPFLAWSAGVAVLIFTGMTKYSAFQTAENGAALESILNRFPKIMMSIMGVSQEGMQTVGGFYAVLEYYVTICTIIYAIHLGANAVSRESIDKTYEFIFTRPCTRSYILSRKILAALTCMILFNLIQLLISYVALSALNIENTIPKAMNLFGIGVFLNGFLFFSLSAFFSAFAKRLEKGTRNSYLCFMVAFVFAILFDTYRDIHIFQILSPIKYFMAEELLKGKFDLVFLGVCLILSGLLIGGTFVLFEKKDLQAVS